MSNSLTYVGIWGSVGFNEQSSTLYFKNLLLYNYLPHQLLQKVYAMYVSHNSMITCILSITPR